MKKKIGISFEEGALLKNLSNDQLRYLDKLHEDKDFEQFVKLIDFLIDEEKQTYFRSKNLDPQKLYAMHAYTQGAVGKLKVLFHLFVAAKHELTTRQKKEK